MFVASVRLARPGRAVTGVNRQLPQPAMKLLRLLTFTAASIVATAPAFAGLIGATVTGTLSFNGGGGNSFDPATGFVPPGYGNSAPGNHVNVLISGAASEFGFGDAFTNPIVANFTDTQLIISSTYLIPSNSTVLFPWMMTFSSSAFSGQSLGLVGQTYTPGLTSSLVGNLVTINWAGGSGGPNTPMQATFNIGTLGVSDNGATALMLVGVLLALAAGQRRLKLAR